MSFYTNNQMDNQPCSLSANGLNLTEKICIQVKKVFDACMKQQTKENVTLKIKDWDDKNECKKFTFVSAKSSSSKAKITNATYEKIKCQGNLNRVSADIEIPMEVVLVDEEGRDFVAKSSIKEHFDVVMSLPGASIIPFELEAVVSCICPNGKTIDANTFSVTACETIILKIVAESELLVPSYGYCPIPPCQEFSEEVCSGFFELPLFPNSPNSKQCR